MKIGFSGINLPEGKVKYKDGNLEALAKKDAAKKISPFFAEFLRDEFVQCEAIVIHKDKILDLLILDMEKIESRLSRSSDNVEKALFEKCLKILEQETPLCDSEFRDEEKNFLKAISIISIKPVVKVEEDIDANTVISSVLEKADYMFFYTSCPKESHAWLVKKGSTIIACAEKIHSDFARGFIKGDVVGFENYLNCHSFNDCKAKGLAKLVDRDYIVQPNEIIEIRFNV